jgi:hypothetical protein
MALTIAEYYQLIILEVKTQPTISSELKGELDAYPNAIDRMRTLFAQLTSNSKVAFWRLWAFVMAVICWIQATLWDKAKEEITVLANAAIKDTDQAFLREVKLFEYPGTAVIDPVTKEIVFSPSNPDNQIIKTAAIITDSLGVSNILVAQDDGAGGLMKIPSVVLDAFRVYLAMIQPVGTNVQGDSRDADRLKISLNVWYDPLAGYSDPTAFETEVNNALVASLLLTDFKSRTQKQVIEDAVRAVPGYKNLDFTILQAKSDAAISYSNFQNGEYTAVAGYLKPATGADWVINVFPYLS